MFGLSSKKRWIIPAVLVLIVVLGFVIMPHALERMFLYFPIKQLEGDPSVIGLAFQNLSIITDDRVALHGWFIPYPGAKQTLLIFHGNAGNISHRLPWIEILHDLCANVMIIDYRGYGKSEGSPFEEGLYRDARAAFAWWTKERAGTGEQLVLFGESIGGAVAVNLAARTAPAGLIIQSTFTSARDMARTVFPLGLLEPLARVRFDSRAEILRVKCPKLIIHGNRDEIVPFRMGKALYEIAPGPKEFYEVPGAGHNDLPWQAGPDYVKRLRTFLNELKTS